MWGGEEKKYHKALNKLFCLKSVPDEIKGMSGRVRKEEEEFFFFCHAFFSQAT